MMINLASEMVSCENGGIISIPPGIISPPQGRSGLFLCSIFACVLLNLAIGLDLAFNFACVCGNLADLALDCLSFACVFVNLADWA